jgi:hypothetical protein
MKVSLGGDRVNLFFIEELSIVLFGKLSRLLVTNLLMFLVTVIYITVGPHLISVITVLWAL